MSHLCLHVCCTENLNLELKSITNYLWICDRNLDERSEIQIIPAVSIKSDILSDCVAFNLTTTQAASWRQDRQEKYHVEI